MAKHILIVSTLLCLARCAAAESAQLCVYQTADGNYQQVSSLNEVPLQLRRRASCFDQREREKSGMAKPAEIKLEGSVRRETISSPIGRVDLRWPRKVESLFGRTPLRAMAEAAQTVSRTLNSPGFPSNVQHLNLNWQVVFMDADMPEAQIPVELLTNCHPGWMTPPSNIYIVAQRVAGGCGGTTHLKTSVADAELATVLVHEIGHAVEYQLLQGAGGLDRMRAEGFATWFEQYAAGFSSLISPSLIKRYQNEEAKRGFAGSPGYFNFQGSPEDYARASMYFRAVVNRRGVRGLMDVYKLMQSTNADFLTAAQKELSLTGKKFEEEAQRAAS